MQTFLSGADLAMPSPFSRIFAVGLAASVLVTTPVPAMAQDGVSEARIRKIEAEVRALQRNVFPGGEGRFFEPQIAPGQPTGSTASTNAPSTTAVTDILVRLDALESQLQRLTARSEENTNAIALLSARVGGLDPDGSTAGPQEPSAAETNLQAMTGGASAASSNVVQTSGSRTNPSPEINVGSSSSGSAPTAPVATGPSAARLAAVQEIAKPQTGDAADDEYSYGFRLWNAGFYPEAQQQLSMFVERFGDHWRATYARNLLGRAYLDDGNAREAAPWFLRNYQTDKQAARAGDSLLYLAEAMIALGDTNRACIALAEFGETYTALASGRLLVQYEANRQKVTCN
jgi:TolA-binding protein